MLDECFVEGGHVVNGVYELPGVVCIGRIPATYIIGISEVEEIGGAF
jgi:hypothetical protein